MPPLPYLAFQHLGISVFQLSPLLLAPKVAVTTDPFAFRLSLSLTFGVFRPNGSGTSDAPDPLCR